MTRNGIIDAISLLRLNWCNYMANATQKEFEAQINLWGTMFRNYDDKIVHNAIMNLISTSKFVPSIAEIKENICDQMIVTLTEAEIREHIQKSVKNSLYNSKEEWRLLPDQLQKIVSPDDLYKMATGTIESLNFKIKDIIQEYKGLIGHAKEQIKTTGSTNLIGSGSLKAIETGNQDPKR